MRTGRSPACPTAPAGVWVVEPHPVIRRGMVAVLTTGGLPWPGTLREGARLADLCGTGHPAPTGAAVLVCPVEDPLFGPMTAGGAHSAGALASRVVATVRGSSSPPARTAAQATVAAVLVLDDLTPHNLLATVCAVSVAVAGSTARPVTRPRLTDRELRILHLLADGEDTRAIAARLNYSERTVKAAVHDALAKLHCRTRAQAVGLATRAGLI